MRVRKSNRTVGTRRIYDSLKKDCACACKNFMYSVGCCLMGDGQKTMKYCVFCFACGQRRIFPECKWFFLQKILYELLPATRLSWVFSCHGVVTRTGAMLSGNCKALRALGRFAGVLNCARVGAWWFA